MKFKCGHSKTPENTEQVGHGWTRCLICKRESNRAYMRRVRNKFRPLEQAWRTVCG